MPAQKDNAVVLLLTVDRQVTLASSHLESTKTNGYLHSMGPCVTGQQRGAMTCACQGKQNRAWGTFMSSATWIGFYSHNQVWQKWPSLGIRVSEELSMFSSLTLDTSVHS